MTSKLVWEVQHLYYHPLHSRLQNPQYQLQVSNTATPSSPPILPPTPTPTPYLPPTIVSPQSSPPPPPIDTNVPTKPLITQGYPSSSYGGLNGGQKEGIGIAIGVIFKAKALFLGGLMYKRRRSKFLI